ncbi:hypothetical protein H1C71_021348 [Ictidomys tridecemlineatus]|nr:hypothetical protein H1C71_021348 [Ictidomys tridecemlineatus]
MNPSLTFQSIPSSKATIQTGLVTDWSCSNLSKQSGEGGSQKTVWCVSGMLTAMSLGAVLASYSSICTQSTSCLPKTSKPCCLLSQGYKPHERPARPQEKTIQEKTKDKTQHPGG